MYAYLCVDILAKEGPRKIVLEVETSDTIHNIKSRIEKQEGIPYHQQKLHFCGDVLHPHHTLSYCSIQTGCTIQLECSFNISMHVGGGDTLYLEIGAHHTIERINGIIYDKTKEVYKVGVPPESQQLEYKGRQLEDSHTLHDYQVQDDSVLCLKTSLQVIVKTPSEDIPFMVDYFDHTSEVKKRIERERNLLSSQQQLKHREIELEDNRTFIDYLSEWGESPPINLFLHCTLSITVSCSEGERSITFDVRASDTIESIKEKIQGESSMKCKDPWLTYLDTELSDDSRTLQSYNVPNNALIKLHSSASKSCILQ